MKKETIYLFILFFVVNFSLVSNTQPRIGPAVSAGPRAGECWNPDDDVYHIKNILNVKFTNKFKHTINKVSFGFVLENGQFLEIQDFEKISSGETKVIKITKQQQQIIEQNKNALGFFSYQVSDNIYDTRIFLVSNNDNHIKKPNKIKKKIEGLNKEHNEKIIVLKKATASKISKLDDERKALINEIEQNAKDEISNVEEKYKEEKKQQKAINKIEVKKKKLLEELKEKMDSKEAKLKDKAASEKAKIHGETGKQMLKHLKK